MAQYGGKTSNIRLQLVMYCLQELKRLYDLLTGVVIKIILISSGITFVCRDLSLSVFTPKRKFVIFRCAYQLFKVTVKQLTECHLYLILMKIF